MKPISISPEPSRLHGPPLAAAHALLTEIGAQNRIALLRGARAHAPGRQGRFRPGQAARPGMGSRGRREQIPRARLSVRRIPGIGRVTEAALASMGIETVGQLAGIPEERLQEFFGRWGTALYRKARGEDSYEFVD